MLKDLLKSELTDLKLARFSKEVVDGIIREVSSLMDWCLGIPVIEACEKEVTMINDIAEKLANVRLGKILEADPAAIDSSSIDGELLSKLIELIRKYEKLVLMGFLDSEGNVPVVITSDYLVLNNHRYSKGSLTLLKSTIALFLEVAGLVKIVRTD
ncbi:MAG: hypothetical protein QN229_03260 [Desulfurococcaceae archaeon TW002]